MIRFRIWDNEAGEYLENLDSFNMDNEGFIRWYDGAYLNPVYVPGISVQMPGEGRYEVEFGNEYCFHNDIIKGRVYGGTWDITEAGQEGWNTPVPREHLNMHIIKNDKRDIHTLYWDRPIRGIAVMSSKTMEFTICGLNCSDRFYDYDGCQFSWHDISVVGNARLDEHKFCKRCEEMYKREVEDSILPPKGEE